LFDGRVDMSFTLAFHYDVKCPDTPGGFIPRSWHTWW
jgi:hypothetical protein